jgi:4-hydroxybenzoate polyprenyltransferase
MKIAKALLQLVRFPNLVFIFITQYAAYTCLIFPTLDSLFEVAILQTPRFYYLLFSTLCIAAAGYIINDYFDIGMDAINKPEK